MGDDWWRDAVFLLGILILTFTLLRVARRKRRQQAENAQPPVDHRSEAIERSRTEPMVSTSSDAAISAAGSELNSLLIQIQELGREIEARLDTRVRLARRVMEDADETLLRLEKLVVEAKQVVGAAGEPSETSPAAADELFATTPPAGSLDVRAGESEEAEPEPVTGDPHEQEIARLVADGRTEEQIAAEVDRPIGEVRLILSLIETKNRNAS